MTRLATALAVLAIGAGCSLARPLPAETYRVEPFDALLVPGCPTNADGTLSVCQWRRTVWAAALYHEGSVRYLVPSGAAVRTPYTEAVAMAAGLRALGVPDERILLETQALHTDHNAGYAIHLFRRLGFERVGVASDRFQATMVQGMTRKWGAPLTAVPIDEAVVAEAFAAGLPEVRVTPVPDWEVPEGVRSSSFAYYLGLTLTSDGGEEAIPVPPGETRGDPAS